MKQQPVTTPAAVEQLYSLWIWLDERVADFPVHARHGLGRRLLDTVLEALDQVTRAAYAERTGQVRRVALSEANHRLAFLRLLLRGARDRRHLSLNQHAFAMEAVVAVGKGVGAWLKQAKDP